MAIYFGDLKLADATEIIMPPPRLHLLNTGATPQLAISYLPTPHTAWLQNNPEVWLFAYRRPRKNNGGIGSNLGGFVHPTHSTRRETNTAVYTGKSKRKTVDTTYTTEYPFEYDGRQPDPYERVPLTGFNHLEFYWHVAGDRRPVAGDFPITKIGGKSPIICPRMASLRTRFYFRFAIDNPAPGARTFKLFSPPSVVLHCVPMYTGTFKALQPNPAETNNAKIQRFRFTL
jgi:hypothetical protein